MGFRLFWRRRPPEFYGVSVSISKTFKANLALSAAAFLWGTTFIYQRQAMDDLEPLAYGGLRFTLGALALLPLALPRAKKLLKNSQDPAALARLWLLGGLVSGTFLFVGITFQQYGLKWTTAGKAGFITSLYVVLVPLILRLMGHRIDVGQGWGALLAMIGLYFLSFSSGLEGLSLGDLLVFTGAFIWAGHVIALGWLSPKMDSIILGVSQALFCGLLGLAATVVCGQWPTLAAVRAAWLPLVWGGLLSVACGFTLQVIGQKDAEPATAAIILQMEAVVAVLAGHFSIYCEPITSRMLWGMALMLTGMLLSQLGGLLVQNKH